MKRQIMRKLLAFSVLVSSFSLLSSGLAYAHVTVKPADVLTGAYQTFTTSVPNEKDIPVTTIRLVIQADVKSVTPTMKQGWEINAEQSNGNVTEITWTGGIIDVGLRDEFTFSAQAPEKPGEIVWKAYQTYQDGSMVSWDQAPTDDHGHESEDENKGPYSVTNVSDDSAEDQTDSSDGLLYALVGVSILLSAVALIRSARS